MLQPPSESEVLEDFLLDAIADFFADVVAVFDSELVEAVIMPSMSRSSSALAAHRLGLEILGLKFETN